MTTSSASNTNVIADIQDATPSWSGYNHQGKVALYLVLNSLNKLREDGLSTAAHAVEIEYLEDIAILKEGKYLSLHQVKSYKTTTLSAYQDAIWILLGKYGKYTPIDGVYLHTVRPIKHPTVKEVKALNASKNVKAIRDRVLKSIDALYPNFQLFPYSSENSYCPLDEIDKEINTQISTYFSACGLEGYDINKKRLKLLSIIHAHIVDRHVAKQQNKKFVNTADANDASPVIPFPVFEACLVTNDEEPSDFYLLCQLKEWFTKVCDEYIAFLQEDGEEDLDNLLQAVSLLCSLTYKEFQLFCRKANPHVNWRELDLFKFKELFEKTSTQASLLLAVQKVSKQLHHDRFAFESNSKFYMPTTIHGGPSDIHYERNRRRTARDILLNTALDEIVMEVNTFISSQMEMSSLQEAANIISEADPELDRNHITRLGPISMISVKRAVEEIQ